MNTASRVLFENQHYVACVTRAGLTVQNKHQSNGKLLPLTAADFKNWLSSFETAINASESTALCRAIYHCAA